MRLLLVVAFAFITICASAQEELGWVAPEGKILNYRTLTWNDFQGKSDEGYSNALAFVCPAIYYKADSGERLANGRVTFKFHVKCAFQSRAFVREVTVKEHTNYFLLHEQDHYDIALNFANKLQRDLSSRDYSADKYEEELDKIGDDLIKAYNKVQQDYDNQVNPEGRLDKEKQYLWDMRIRKCYENNTDEYYSSPENIAQSVKMPGQVVKRIPGEAARLFVVRCRPIYTEFPAEMMAKTMETTEWGPEPAIVAFYTQKFYQAEDGVAPKDNYRTFAYVFVPTAKDMYKRILVDTFYNAGLPVKIAGAFFANADSDNVKELVIMAKSEQHGGGANGTMYMNRAYDNVSRPLPGKLKRIDAISSKIEGGFDGDLNGKPMKGKCKTEQEVRDALKK